MKDQECKRGDVLPLEDTTAKGAGISIKISNERLLYIQLLIQNVLTGTVF